MPMDKDEKCSFSTKKTKGKTKFFFENRKSNDAVFIFRPKYACSQNFIQKFKLFFYPAQFEFKIYF